MQFFINAQQTGTVHSLELRKNLNSTFLQFVLIFIFWFINYVTQKTGFWNPLPSSMTQIWPTSNVISIGAAILALLSFVLLFIIQASFLQVKFARICADSDRFRLMTYSVKTKLLIYAFERGGNNIGKSCNTIRRPLPIHPLSRYIIYEHSPRGFP